MKTDNYILSAQNIHASYYKKEILHGVSVSVRKGEILCLIGPNGAGKSTLLKVIIGILSPGAGRVYFEGEDVTNLSPHLRVRKGIGYFIQGGEVFPNLTVLENLKLGGADLPKEALKNHLNEVFDLFPKLDKIRLKRAGLLSGGQRHALALGIVLMRRPKLLLLDEPSAGLAPSLVKETMSKVQGINENFGISILVVEQNLREVLMIAQRAYLLKTGRIVGEEEIAGEGVLEEKILEELFFGQM